MKNDDHTIGLFQGMFDSNLLTFNSGWDKNRETLKEFDDVRKLHENFKSKGIEIVQDAISGETGSSSFAIIDPGGNAILIDQNV